MRNLFLIFLTFTSLISALPIESPAEESVAAENLPETSTESDASAASENQPPTVSFIESNNDAGLYWVILHADSGYKSPLWPVPEMYGSKDEKSMSQIRNSIAMTLKNSGLGPTILPVYFGKGRSGILRSLIETSADKHGWHLSIPVKKKAFWKKSESYHFGSDPTKFRSMIWPKLQEGFPEIVLPEDELAKFEEGVTAKEETYRSGNGKKKRPQQPSEN